jgi:hypothetical protein
MLRSEISGTLKKVSKQTLKSKKNREYYRKNKAKIMAKRSQRKEEMAQYQKDYKIKNKLKVRQKNKQWYNNNKEKKHAYYKAYYSKNKERIKKYQLFRFNPVAHWDYIDKLQDEGESLCNHKYKDIRNFARHCDIQFFTFKLEDRYEMIDKNDELTEEEKQDEKNESHQTSQTWKRICDLFLEYKDIPGTITVSFGTLDISHLINKENFGSYLAQDKTRESFKNYIGSRDFPEVVKDKLITTIVDYFAGDTIFII